MKVLITYTSKYGSTAEIAEAIYNHLVERGIETDFLEISEVIDVDVYSAFFIGSPIYNGSWTKQAQRFLKKNKELLSNKKVWLFSTGPIGKTNSAELLFEWKMPKKILSLAFGMNAIEVKIFPGYIQFEKLSVEDMDFFEKNGAPNIDSRNWNEIKLWSEKAATKLLANNS
ncbi:MAG TPA: flavodoxin domain-containing protein [Bacteroidales bacterium]|nr:flavodoxin domain-containing protein [Bacteroidales bacterium]